MKKSIAFVLVFVFVLSLVGCSSGIEFEAENIKNIFVSSLPGGYDYSFSGDDANAIVDYLVNFDLTPYYEVIDEVGMAWVISIEYENGRTTRVYHNCNKYIKVDDGSWYKMSFEEANRFNTLLDELSK